VSYLYSGVGEQVLQNEGKKFPCQTEAQLARFIFLINQSINKAVVSTFKKIKSTQATALNLLPSWLIQQACKL
jgi:hypothetical protein